MRLCFLFYKNAFSLPFVTVYPKNFQPRQKARLIFIHIVF